MCYKCKKRNSAKERERNQDVPLYITRAGSASVASVLPLLGGTV